MPNNSINNHDSRHLIGMIVIFILVPAIAVLLLSFFEILPLRANSVSIYPYCREVVSEDTILGIYTNRRVKSSSFSKYWRSSVEPNHRHKLYFLSGGRQFIGVCRLADGEYPILPSKEAELAILRSIPKRFQRVRLINAWLSAQQSSTLMREQWIKRMETVDKLYRANPRRKDWRDKLIQLGCWL